MAFFGGGEKVQVVAEIHARTGCKEAVRAMLTALVVPSRKENGCKQYHLHEDTKNPGSFDTCEEWASEALLEEHLGRAKQTLEQAEPLLDGDLKLVVLKLLV
ncbi:putative quinol monooxygenase [Granulicella arctica]|uniref:Quinol monooxygenase YgiN n=1 Tax=Granulicella arctica TaxID=940613 RepID=A0A7Y9PDH3_9BACT|nr:putative quinol monooxygenase [Granulicella arctica]NYF77917.1 quinol monooxygenase YgiN [Granulicella arctica]